MLTTRPVTATGRAKIAPRQVHSFLHDLLADDVHATRVLSVGNAVVGALHASALGIHAIGRGLAAAAGLDPRHAVKQVDRLLSNRGFDVWRWLEHWVPFIVADRKEIVVALDWTEFEKDGHATIALNLVTSHGRATALLWKTVRQDTLKSRRSEYERAIVDRLHEILPPEVGITVLADRGFGDQKFYAYLHTFGWSYIIRFRECILVTSADGETRPAGQWVPPSGHAKMLRDASVTDDRGPVGAVVVKHQKGMKEAWCLATNRTDLAAAEVLALYGRRFTIEETFRDLKDPRFGVGLGEMRIGSPERRDRLIFLFAVAQALVTLLGAAGEAAGLDRTLKTNTDKKRQLSLFNQGRYWFEAIPAMREERLVPLMREFDRLLNNHAAFRDIFGVI